MKFGLFLYKPLAFNAMQKVVENMTSVGLHGMELRTSRTAAIEEVMDSLTRENICRMLSESGVKLVALNSACAFHWTDHDEVTANIDEVKRFVELACELGARAVKVRPDGLQTEKGVEAGQTLDQIGRSLRACGIHAEEYGIELWLEVHGSGTSHPPYIKHIVEYADHPQVKVCWNCNESDLDDHNSILTYFQMLQPWIAHIHMHDLFNKTYPYPILYGLLAEAGYDGYIMSENPADDTAENLTRYRDEMWAKLQG